MSPAAVFALLAVLALSLPGETASAGSRHKRYEHAPPVPAWVFGVERGDWTNFADHSFLVLKAGPPGGVFVGYRPVPVTEVSAMRIWRPVAVRATLGRSNIEFAGIDFAAIPAPRIGEATCDQIRLSALLPIWSIRLSDDRRPGITQWVVGLYTGPIVGWTRLSDLRPSAAGFEYFGIERVSVESGLQAGWESWIGGPLWFDGPLAHVLLFFDLSVVGFGKGLVGIHTTPASAIHSGGSRVAPATFKIGLALLKNLEPGHP